MALRASAFVMCLWSFTAAAQTPPDCNTLPNPVYLSSTTDMKPFYARVGGKLAAAAGADRMTLVYKGASTCAAYGALLPPGAPLTGTASYWENDASGNAVEKTCGFPATPEIRATVAVGDLTVDTCTSAALPAGFGAFRTLAQAFGFVVPIQSPQTAITAEEAYFLLKFGAQAGYQVPPWTDPSLIFIRNPNASTQLAIGFSAGISGRSFSSNLAPNASATDVLTKVAAQGSTGNADKTIGLLSAAVYNLNRDKVKMLAFQAFGQQCLGAVLPDSRATTFDKRNVRDGHYEIFTYTYVVAPVDGGGAPTDPAAKKFIDFMTGTRVINGADPVGDAARAGSIPPCAMTVKRSADGAPIESYAPPEPCGCFFESVVATTSCAPCTNGSCPGTQVCRFGFCEER